MRGTPLSVVVAIALSGACGMAPRPGQTDPGSGTQRGVDGGVQQPPPETDGGSAEGDSGVPQPPPTPDAGLTGGVLPPGVDGGSLALDPAVALPVPPAPTPDDPAACAPQALPFPDLSPRPDRPCTAEDAYGTTAYRYDAAGRVVYRAVHVNGGSDATYTLEEDGGVRIETWVGPGSTPTQDVTQLQDGVPVQVDHSTAAADGGFVLDSRSTWQLKDGKPIESDHFKAAADGGLVRDSHTTWLYDDQGREQYLISQSVGTARFVQRNVYDMKGRPYFVDQSLYWPGKTIVANHRFTARSWFANGVLAHQYQTCDIVGGAPCGIFEDRWEPCGHLAYSGNQTGLLRGSSFADWTWDPGGRPLTEHHRWNGTGDFFNSTESYQVDDAGRAISGAILKTNPPGFVPAAEQHETSYRYDAAGRLIERLLDGSTDFHATFDAAGRLVELTRGSSTTRWTYDGCGR